MPKMKFKGKDYYQIEKDDDYFKIGKKLYDKYLAAPLIAQANPDFEFLKTGAVIALPENVLAINNELNQDIKKEVNELDLPPTPDDVQTESFLGENSEANKDLETIDGVEEGEGLQPE